MAARAVAKKKAPKLPKYLYAPASPKRELIYLLPEEVHGADIDKGTLVVAASPRPLDAKRIARGALGSTVVVRYVLESSIRPGGKS